MWKIIMAFVIKVFKSPVGKAIIMGGVKQYVKSNDNECTKEIAKAIEEML